MSTAFQKEVAQNLGNIPFVYYGSYQIEVHDIYFLSLFYNGGIPYLKLTFYDTLNIMRDRAMPLDDSKIKIFLNPRSEQLKEILIQFKIINFVVNGSVYTIDGIIDVDLLHVIQYKSYPKLTSHKVLQQISKEAGLGFNTNIDDTDDEMTWINPGKYVSDFMEEIVESSYKSDSSFIASFIDYYYNFNLVDLEKEIERDIDKQLGITDRSLSEVVSSIKPENVTNLIITNDDSFRESNLFIENFTIINNSTLISLEAGYKNIIKYYDEIKKDLLVFNIDSITTQTNDKIILKGAPQDNTFYSLNVNTYYVGKFDEDNCHKNYNYAWIQNEKNLSEIEKIGIEVTLRTPNFSIYKYQKIKVFISNQSSTPSTALKNSRLSGDWLVIDMKFIFTDGKFTQILRLSKRELELSDDELSQELKLNSSNSGENTDNPDVNNDFNNANNSPNAFGSTASNNSNSPVEISSILTKDIWRRIYTGKVNDRVIEIMYNPVVSALEKYGMNTKNRIITFLSQINVETGFLKAVTEYASGAEYNNNTNLGNGPTDGPKYKGRGLIQITGKNNYSKSGKYLNKDFINNPYSVSAENNVHLKAADTQEQLSNTVMTSIWYWINGSSWGNLNDYTDRMDINNSIDVGNINVPNTQNDAKQKGYKVSKGDNFATEINSSNKNLYNFTIICFGINGGYNGYKDRIDNWNNMRKYFI